MDFLLKYEGLLADRNELDFYDAAKALAGFQRSLALTTHLVVNGEIITQAPSLKNARIFVATPRPGSWEVIATVGLVIWAGGTASKDSPFGHILYSVYDYVVSQVFGFPVSYDKSLRQSYEEYLASKDITPARLDSLAEKIESSLADMHRPIVASRTADHADVFGAPPNQPVIRLGRELNSNSYDHIKQFEVDDFPSVIDGVVSSYNRNTYGGRVYIHDEERPIGFELVDGAKTIPNVDAITTSLRTGAIEKGSSSLGAVKMTGFKVKSSTGRLKGFRVIRVEPI